MGNINKIVCGQCGLDPMGDGLIEMLKTANNLSLKDQRYLQLLTNNEDQLRTLIRNRKRAKQTFGDVLIRVIPYSKKPLQNFNELISSQIKLILRIDMDQSQNSYTIHSSNKPERLNYKGCIIFSNGYYYGDIQDDEASGQGILCFHQELSHQIQGYWEHGSFKNGKVYRIKYENDNQVRQLVFQIQIKNGQKLAVVNVKNKFIYQGSIQLANSFHYEDILTGYGVVKYPNGDKYHGPLVKGKYETELGKTGTFHYSQGECICFKGSYKSGLRDDIGVFQFDLQGTRASLHIAFSEGVPHVRGLIRLEDESQYSVQVANEGLLVQSKIQLP